EMVVLRGVRKEPISGAAVEERSEFDPLSAVADPQKILVAELGILGVEIDQRIAAAATGLRDPFGIIVVARAAGATSEVPIQARDVIRQLNNRQMATLEGLRDAVRALPAATPATLQIHRQGRLMDVAFIPQ